MYPEGRQEMKTMFRTCATQRLFFKNMFPYLDSAIYIDTDFLFLRPVDLLFESFSNFTERAFAAMAPCMAHYGVPRNHVPYYGEYGLNAGIMLMNLTRIRAYQPGFQKSLLEIMDKYKSRLYLADQDILNIFFSFHPELHHNISCSWSFRPLLCNEGQDPCYEAEIMGIDGAVTKLNFRDGWTFDTLKYN